MEKKRISIKEAATVLGVSEQFLRVWLRDENPPFGKAVKMSPKRWTYYINQKRLDQYVAGENDKEKDRNKRSGYGVGSKREVMIRGGRRNGRTKQEN